MAYKLDQSPLYLLSSRNKLARILGLSLFDLERLANNGTQEYKLFSKKTSSGKERHIEWPKPLLFKTASRLVSLITRIEIPDYVHSGIKGRSYVTNARCHKVDVALAKIDLRSFFNSASSLYVYRCFKNTFRCSSDVSSILCKLSTIEGHLPTGSPTSVIMSYYAYQSMFDEIYSLALKQELTMSLCVDDMTFSGDKAGSEFLYFVRTICKKYGLKVHKRHCFTSDQNKIVTGVALTPQGTRLPNKRRKRVFESIQAFTSTNSTAIKLQLASGLMGRLAEASQVEPKTFIPMRSFLKKAIIQLRK